MSSNQRKSRKRVSKRVRDSDSSSSDDRVVVDPQPITTWLRPSILIGVGIPLLCAILYASKWLTLWSILYHLITYITTATGITTIEEQGPSMLTTHFLS